MQNKENQIPSFELEVFAAV